MMFRTAAALLLSVSSALAFQPSLTGVRSRPSTTSLNIVKDEAAVLEKIKQIIAAGDYPEEDPAFDNLVKSSFPGAISNQELESKVVDILSQKGFNGSNTLLATSLCADELARVLEDDFVKIYGNNFNLGGLAGFPFAGNTGFGAMSAHIPDNGFCLVVYGPHVGITQDGLIGKVERQGVNLVDNCCGSAIAASNYLRGITEGGAVITTEIQSFSDFQQGAVQELILPHGKRLADAGEFRMKELPYALYDSQDLLMQDIVDAGKGGLKQGTAVLGGVQINTSPETLDYFHPLRFEYIGPDGEVMEDLLPLLLSQQQPSEPVPQSVAQNKPMDIDPMAQTTMLSDQDAF